MRQPIILVTRILIALSLLGSIVVQVVILPLIWADLAEESLGGRVVLVTLAALGILTLQICAVCIWRLLTLVRRGSVFSADAFRYVDVIIGAIAAASVLMLAFAIALAPGETAPGIVGLLCGASLVIAAVALLVVIMRMLLAQAIERDGEARALCCCSTR